MAISVMLEMECGAPNINRLRIIHLFEADYILFLKIMWANRLVEWGKAKVNSANRNKGPSRGGGRQRMQCY